MHIEYAKMCIFMQFGDKKNVQFLAVLKIF